MDNYFIVAGVDTYGSIYWVKNTDPLVWCYDKSDAKRYICVGDAYYDIHMDEDTIRHVFNTSSMDRIEAYEIDSNDKIVSIELLLKKGVYNV